MTHATDKDNNESVVSHTTPAAQWGDSTINRMLRRMQENIYRYISKDVSDQSLLSMVVDTCYTLDSTIEYLGVPAHDKDLGYKMRLRAVRQAISTALQYYTYGRKYPS